MKFVISILSFSLITGCASLSSNKSVQLNEFKEIKLKNGLPVILVKDSSLPYISFTMLIKSGSSRDPDKLSGLSSMTASLLEKGTKAQSASQIAETLDQIGASFSASVGKDYAMASASGLAFHQSQILEKYAEILSTPTFPSQEIERVRKLTLAGLKKSVDNPGRFVSRVFDSYLYGAHPYGAASSGSLRSVKRIRKKNIIRYYIQNYRPNNAHLAVVGNFSDDIVKKLESAFGNWKQRSVSELQVPQFPKIQGLQIQLINKPDLKQTQIRFGHRGIKRSNPDFLPLRVANTILGGDFSSRLMDEIRVKRGLTYSISSYFESRKSQGPFVISTFTRHDKVQETIQETINVLKAFRKNGVTEKEVKSAKAQLKGRFPRAIETPESLAENLLLLRYHGIPDTYLTKYIGTVEEITAADVNRAIDKYITPENMKVLLYSSSRAVRSQIKKIGDVKVKNYRDFL